MNGSSIHVHGISNAPAAPKVGVRGADRNSIELYSIAKYMLRDFELSARAPTTSSCCVHYCILIINEYYGVGESYVPGSRRLAPWRWLLQIYVIRAGAAPGRIIKRRI